MRLDARKDDRYWNIWHCELMKMLPYIVWVDDCIKKYGQWNVKPMTDSDIIEFSAKDIIIDVAAKTVFINPISDSEVDSIPARTGVNANV